MVPRLSETMSVGCHDVSELDYVIYIHESPFSAFYNKHLGPGLAARVDDLSPSPGSSLPELPDLAPGVASREDVFLSSHLAEKLLPHGWDAGLGNHFQTRPAKEKTCTRRAF